MIIFINNIYIYIIFILYLATFYCDSLPICSPINLGGFIIIEKLVGGKKKCLVQKSTPRPRSLIFRSMLTMLHLAFVDLGVGGGEGREGGPSRCPDTKNRVSIWKMIVTH